MDTQIENIVLINTDDYQDLIKMASLNEDDIDKKAELKARRLLEERTPSMKINLRFAFGDNYRMHEHIRVSTGEDITPQMESVALKAKLWAQETFEEICEMIDIKLACEEAIERKDKETCNAVRWADAGWLTSIALFAILVAVFVFK